MENYFEIYKNENGLKFIKEEKDFYEISELTYDLLKLLNEEVKSGYNELFLSSLENYSMTIGDFKITKNELKNFQSEFETIKMFEEILNIFISEIFEETIYPEEYFLEKYLEINNKLSIIKKKFILKKLK